MHLPVAHLLQPSICKRNRVMTGRVYYVMVQDRPLVKFLTFQNGTQGTAAATATGIMKRGSPDYDLLYL